jgi:hypothetical protein
MMEAANASETSVNFYQTSRRNNPEDGHLHRLSSSTYFDETQHNVTFMM